MKREFDFLKKIDKLQNGFLETAHERVFEFGKSKRAIFVTVTCSQRGNCSLPEYKPLLCKFYPFLPKLNEKTGKISGFYFASVLDLYWSKLSLPHPCYFLNHRMSRLDAILRKFEPFVNDPYVIFYLKAAELLSVRLVKDLKLKYPSIFKIGPDLFFSKWEGLYLSGRIINLNEYRAELKNLYDRLVNRFGSFEI